MAPTLRELELFAGQTTKTITFVITYESNHKNLIKTHSLFVSERLVPPYCSTFKKRREKTFYSKKSVLDSVFYSFFYGISGSLL